MNWRRWLNVLSWLVPVVLLVRLAIRILMHPPVRAEFWDARWYIMGIAICIPVGLGLLVCFTLDWIRKRMWGEELEPRGFEVIQPEQSTSTSPEDPPR